MLMNAQLGFDDAVEVLKSVSYTIRVPSTANYPEEATSPGRYAVKLYHAPYLSDLITYPITVGTLTRVTTSPASGEFRIVDSINRTRPDVIEFNSAQAGNTYTVSYRAITSIVRHEMIGCITSGYDASIPLYVLNSRDHGANLTNSISDLPAGSKVIYLKNGTYNISSTLTFATYSILELIGESQSGVSIVSTVTGANNVLEIGDRPVRNLSITQSVNLNATYSIVKGSATLTLTDSCQNISTTSFGYTSIAFNNIYYLSNCYAIYGTYGFYECYDLNNCRASNMTQDAFYGCYYVNNCQGSASTVNGFNVCYFLTNCYAKSNSVGFLSNNHVLNCRSTNNSTYGFQANLGMQNNRASSNTTQNYNQTNYNYSDFASNATYQINNANGVDTANGGHNV